MEQEDGVVPPLLDRLGADRHRVSSAMDELLKSLPKVYGSNAQVSLTPALANALNDASAEADKLKDD
jgi:ATP-dependent Clp protease ATP-binding subunit ClpB